MTVSAGSSSSAALCSVSVSKDVLKQDIVLEILLKLVQLKTHQVKVKTVNTKNVLTMTIAGCLHLFMTQRNAILRSLVGAALHGAQDHYKEGMFAGGMFSVSSSAHGTSLQAAANQAGLTQWMSVADQLRNGSESDTESLLTSLNQVLEESAYILPFSATASFADLDLCVALLHAKVEGYPLAVTRWMTQVVAVLQKLAAETGVSLETLVLPSAVVPIQPPVAFFYGTEDADAVLSALYKTGNSSSKKQQKGGKTDKKSQEDKKQQAKPEGGAKKPEKAKADKKKSSDGGAAAGDQATTTYDVTALDIRVGKIIKAWPHETADKLFCEEIDLGGGEIRMIASGLRPFYKDSDLQDRMVLVLCNLKKRNLVGFPSHGMVLCASNADHTAVEFVSPPEGSVIGEKVLFEGLPADTEPEPENKVAKKKVFEGIAPDFRTDEAGNVLWKTHAAKTSAGAVHALNKMPNAHVS